MKKSKSWYVCIIAISVIIVMIPGCLEEPEGPSGLEKSMSDPGGSNQAVECDSSVDPTAEVWRLQNPDYSRGDHEHPDVLRTPDGGLVVGSSTPAGLHLRKLDDTGLVEWENAFSFGPGSIGSLELAQDGSGGLYALATVAVAEGTETYLIAVTQSGDKRWAKTLGREIRFDRPAKTGGDAIGLTDGVAVSIRDFDDEGMSRTVVAHLNASGSLTWGRSYSAGLPILLTVAADGTLRAAGACDSTEVASARLFQMQLNADGTVHSAWRYTAATGTPGLGRISASSVADGVIYVLVPGGSALIKNKEEADPKIWGMMKIGYDGEGKWAKLYRSPNPFTTQVSGYPEALHAIKTAVAGVRGQLIVVGAVVADPENHINASLEALAIGLSSEGGILWSKLYGEGLSDGHSESFSSIIAWRGGLLLAGATDGFGGSRSNPGLYVAQATCDGAVCGSRDASMENVRSLSIAAESLTVTSSNWNEVRELTMGNASEAPLATNSACPTSVIN